jgi:uncharacterized membrane protein
MHAKKRFNVQVLVLIGVLSALVFALSYVQIPVPIVPGDNGRIHLGNSMCLLAGVLFGPLVGGLSAGLGSMLFDLTNPLYISEFWITFLTKFAMGWLAGWLAHHTLHRLHAFPRALLSALGGQALYIVLYVIKSAVWSHFVYGNPWEGVGYVVAMKALTSGINGLMAVAACALLAPALGAALKAAGITKRMHLRQDF